MSSPVIYILNIWNQFLKVFKNNLTKVYLWAGKQEHAIFCVHCMQYSMKNKLIDKIMKLKHYIIFMFLC